MNRADLPLQLNIRYKARGFRDYRKMSIGPQSCGQEGWSCRGLQPKQINSLKTLYHNPPSFCIRDIIDVCTLALPCSSNTRDGARPEWHRSRQSLYRTFKYSTETWSWTSVGGLAQGNGPHSGLLIVMHQWVRGPMGSHGSEVHPLLFLSFWDLKTWRFLPLLPLLPPLGHLVTFQHWGLECLLSFVNNKTGTCPPVYPPLLEQCCSRVTNLGLPVILTQPMAPCGLGNAWRAAWFLCFCHSLSSQGD